MRKKKQKKQIIQPLPGEPSFDQLVGKVLGYNPKADSPAYKKAKKPAPKDPKPAKDSASEQ